MPFIVAWVSTVSLCNTLKGSVDCGQWWPVSAHIQYHIDGTRVWAEHGGANVSDDECLWMFGGLSSSLANAWTCFTLVSMHYMHTTKILSHDYESPWFGGHRSFPAPGSLFWKSDSFSFATLDAATAFGEAPSSLEKIQAQRWHKSRCVWYHPCRPGTCGLWCKD